VIWAGFAVAYQLVRGMADRGTAEAHANGRAVLDAERALGAAFELDVQRPAVQIGGVFLDAVNWTYWLSQFAIVLVGVVWIYLRRHELYGWTRNSVMITNTLGLLVYIAMPTAPPRLLPDLGFVDTLGSSAWLSHDARIVQFVANPYAAMPSLHAADALLIGGALALAARRRVVSALFVLWPVWVAYALIASANHFWLDIAAGFALAGLGAAAAWRGRRGSAMRWRGRCRASRARRGDTAKRGARRSDASLDAPASAMPPGRACRRAGPR
jgi:membrane-associated phospholipid phosphatase